MNGVSKKTNKGRAGFTLVEVLVAMAIALTIAGLMLLTFQRYTETHENETKKNKLQQNLVATLNLMEQEIRLAGYHQPKDKLLAAEPYSLTFMADIDNDGTITLDGDPTNDIPRTEKITYYFDTSTGVLKRTLKAPGGIESEAEFATGLDDLKFQYFDTEGKERANSLELQRVRDEIRRIRVVAKGSVDTVATITEKSAATDEGKIKKVIKKRYRTVIKDITPPNLGIKSLVPCGTLVVEAETPIAACNPPGELSAIKIRTYDADGTLTNSNDVAVTVNQSSKLYADDAGTTLATLPLPGGSRSAETTLYLESGTKIAGEEVTIDARWGPPDPKCFQRMSLSAVSIAPGSACKIEFLNSDFEVTACDAPGCDNTKEIIAQVQDACGNAVPNAIAEFYIPGNDNHDMGTLDGNYTDTVKIQKIADSQGKITLEYKAPNTIFKNPQVVGELLDPGTGCSPTHSQDIDLVPCDPDNILWLPPEDPKGCMNKSYPFFSAVLDACSNPIGDLADLKAELVNPVSDENVSKPDGSQPGSSVFMQPMSATIFGVTVDIYAANYNTRTDDEDDAPRELTFRISQPEVDTPLEETITLDECTCGITVTQWAEFACLFQPGLSLGCPKNAILRATLDNPANLAQVVTTSTSGAVDIYWGDDFSEGPASPTDPMSVDANGDAYIAVRNSTVALGNTVRLELREYDGNTLRCTDTVSLDVVCSQSEIQFLDEQYRPAITYDPYNTNEKIYVGLTDCNRVEDEKIKVKLSADSGDQEELWLDEDPDGDMGETYYRNATGFPITAIDKNYALRIAANDGTLQVYPTDTIYVTYEDDTAGCPCPDISEDEVKLTNICLPMALYSGSFATFQGTSFRVHWGDVLVKGDVDFTGQLENKVPRKDRTMSISDTTKPYSGNDWPDRWTDIYLKGDIKDAPSSAVQPFYPTYPNIFQHVPEENLECMMGELDYETLKEFAKENDVYYYSTGDNTIRKPGDDADRNFEDVIKNEAREFIFVDIIDAPSYGDISGEDIDNGVYDSQFPTHELSGKLFYEGFIYIAGDLEFHGLGSTTTITGIISPPEQDMPQPVFPPNGSAEFTDLPVLYDESLDKTENLSLKAHIRGGVYLEGTLHANANVTVLGSMGAERGVDGSGNVEIWYDYQSSRSCAQASSNGCCKIGIEPTNVDLTPGETVKFETTGGEDVTWEISDNQSGGTINPSGLYKAGDNIGATDTIRAEDKEGDCLPGTARVNVVCPPITVSGPTEIRVGDAATYSASGGAGPYTFSVDNTAVAEIDPNTGELTAKVQGTVFVTATDSKGCSKSLSVGVQSAAVGCQTLFFDDFDGGITGSYTGDWYHTGTNQDDWQIGVPHGKCDDPSSAYSGSNVLGNDLGGSGWNGCYQNGNQNYVISPAIDLTGYENPELRFQRWVNVRNGDYAEIYLNCGGGWQLADSQTNVRDSSWQEITMVAGEGTCDNVPNVQFAFLLETNNSNSSGGWNIDDVELCAYPK